MVIDDYLFHLAATIMAYFCKIGQMCLLCEHRSAPLKAFVALWFRFEPVNVDVCCKLAFFSCLHGSAFVGHANKALLFQTAAESHSSVNFNFLHDFSSDGFIIFGTA